MRDNHEWQRPLPVKDDKCERCGKAGKVTRLKTAHVPIYAWVCDDCWNEWVAE